MSAVYVGFWARVGAALIDTLWVSLLLWPVAALVGSQQQGLADRLLADPAGVSPGALLAMLAPGPGDAVVGLLLPALLVLAFWGRSYATPGKMLIHARIADAATLRDPSRRQLLVRYLGYFVSTLPLGLGLIWVGLDPRKQGWHDHLAGTVVIRTERSA